jgi:hypothetical protein
VKIYDTSTGDLLKEITFDNCCSAGIGVHPAVPKIYVNVSREDRVEVIDTHALADLPGSIDVGDDPERGIAIQSCKTQASMAPAASPLGLLALAIALAAMGTAFLYQRT